MSIPQELTQLVEQGYFDRVARGDQRAAGLFTRLAAYALNPNGDPSGWGALRKTGGGHNVEGYSEDAIVLGNDTGNRRNVRDIIGGAGAPGARLQWGGFVERRESDIWERPAPLNAEQMAYLRDGQPAPGPTPPTPQPAPCDLRPVLDTLAGLEAAIIGIGEALRGIVQTLDAIVLEQETQQAEIVSAVEAARQARNVAQNISDRMEAGLPIVEGRAGWAGAMSGKVKG